MAKPDSKRPYRKRKRARSEEETRLRITEAAVELHGTVGPAKTKVTEVADRAGVSRRTVYNHFPNDADLFAACSSHWASLNPFPDPTSWADIRDPTVRLEHALDELYGWYGQNHRMLGNVLRDAPVVESLGALMDDLWGGYLQDVVDALADGWTVAERREADLRATLRVVVDFRTWQILAASETGDRAPVDLGRNMVVGAAASNA